MEGEARRVLDLLARDLHGTGPSATDLRLVAPPTVTGRSTLYFVADSSGPKFVVKIPVLGRTPVDTDPALPGLEQYRALERAHGWFLQEDHHRVSRPVALIEELDAVAMEYVAGKPLPRAVARAFLAPGTARRAVGAAGDALRRLHRHTPGTDVEVDLGKLVDEVRAVEASTLRAAGIELPAELDRALGDVPRTAAAGRRVLLHGDYVPSNLVLIGPDEVGLIDPVLTRIGLVQDDVARFLAVLSSDSSFVAGRVLHQVRRRRRELEVEFRTAYGPAAQGTVMELRLIKQLALRWRRRRDHTRLTGHPQLARARRRVVDGHMRVLLAEAADRLSDRLEDPTVG